jgi:hypothetical protein
VRAVGVLDRRVPESAGEEKRTAAQDQRPPSQRQARLGDGALALAADQVLATDDPMERLVVDRVMVRPALIRARPYR